MKRAVRSKNRVAFFAVKFEIKINFIYSGRGKWVTDAIGITMDHRLWSEACVFHNVDFGL